MVAAPKLPVIVSGGSAAMTTVNPWLAVCTPTAGTRLETWTVKEKVPAVVGVPLSRPAAESVRPGGNVPPAKDHV
jgi:hypothetical protein